MDEQFLRDRISQLRMKKGVSEYQMSLELGHSRGYIQNISSGKSLPSITGLFEICEYFNITPAQFFDEQTDDPSLISGLLKNMKNLKEEGYSSAGRALEWHSRGQRFDPAYLHQNLLSRWFDQRLFYCRLTLAVIVRL